MERLKIEFLNKKKNFQQDAKFFEDVDFAVAYKKAMAWGKRNLHNFNEDMIRMG